VRDHFGNLPVLAGMAFSRDVLLLDDCEGTFTYIIVATGGDDTHEYLAAAAYAGTAGMHLKTRVTAAVENDYIQACKFLGYPESGLLVGRVKVAIPTLAAVKTIDFALSANAGANAYMGQLKWTIATGVVAYIDAAGAAQTVAALENIPYATAFCTLELALDLRTMTYLHARVNGLTADLSGIALYDGGAEAFRYTAWALKATASASPPAQIYAANIYAGQSLEA